MKKGVTMLVPTDFSAAAKAAAHYAAGLAVKIKAKVILLSIIELETSTAILHNWKTLERQLMRSANRDLEKLLKEVKAGVKGELDISYDISAGVPMHEVIERYAIEKKANLIIMGTKGATGLKKILRGTNTATVIAHSSIPVIAVPTKATFKHLAKVVYASDLKNVKSEIQTLSKLANLFQAELLILHTVSTDSTARLNKTLEPELINLSRYAAISYHQVRSNSIEESISSFVDEKKADMLIMFTHELDFYDKLFGKSVTRSMAFQSRVPLLVFNRKVR